MGKKAMLDHFHREDWPYEVVKTDDQISLGRKTVRFMETRMLHWPENRPRPTALRAVLLDAGHTLIRPRGTVEEIYAQHARAAGRPVEELVPEIRRYFGELFGAVRAQTAKGMDLRSLSAGDSNRRAGRPP